MYLVLEFLPMCSHVFPCSYVEHNYSHSLTHSMNITECPQGAWPGLGIEDIIVTDMVFSPWEITV